MRFQYDSRQGREGPKHRMTPTYDSTKIINMGQLIQIVTKKLPFREKKDPKTSHRWRQLTWMVAQTAAASGTQLEKGTSHLSTAQAKRPSGIKKGSKGLSRIIWFSSSIAASFA
ncbi:hypothetical protein BHE74_00056903 [Ensete ventricosum]|uniref:Uncharacterized protein n=1 Tax=Ensete ventricosum TaxID=4639 RepID=A0A444E7T5_ENSVE|nr:hypothetical protein GW17_00030251 [Ensete ventricosum]RWW37920.1 hypothetical protein BHE74_00056903 [Ensete ventricosum]RZR75516.1 hypothetical protein BHM03_00059972 [Ensete ventricosum]